MLVCLKWICLASEVDFLITDTEDMTTFEPLDMEYGLCHAVSGQGNVWIIKMVVLSSPVAYLKRIMANVIPWVVWPCVRLYIFVVNFTNKYTGLIKSNRPLFRFHFSVTYILGKYSVFGKILVKMLHIQYISKLITCYVSFRSSDTKQWHALWIRKSCLNCVTGNISSTYHGL